VTERQWGDGGDRAVPVGREKMVTAHCFDNRLVALQPEAESFG
jgi:hypothetical protein